MAKHRKRSLGLVNDLEGAVDKMTGSIENIGETVMEWVHKIIAGLKRHKKLVVLGVLAVLAYNYFLKEDSDDEDEEEN